MSENFDELEKLLKEQKIKKVPPHLMARFSEEVLERIEQKPRPRFAFRLFPVLVPAAIGIILTSVFLLPDLKEGKPALGPALAPALAPAPRAAQLARAPLSLEQQLRLLEDLGDTTEFNIAASSDALDRMSIEDELRLLEELGSNEFDEDILSYNSEAPSQARG